MVLVSRLRLQDGGSLLADYRLWDPFLFPSQGVKLGHPDPSAAQGKVEKLHLTDPERKPGKTSHNKPLESLLGPQECKYISKNKQQSLSCTEFLFPWKLSLPEYVPQSPQHQVAPLEGGRAWDFHYNPLKVMMLS